MPLITELLKNNEVHILSTGRALILLKDHFKERCTYYDVSECLSALYQDTFFPGVIRSFAAQMIKTLQYAREKSQKIIASGFDKVISDCRYDVYDTPDNSFLIIIR